MNNSDQTFSHPASAEYHRQPHASIDSNNLPERNSIDIFCRVSQEWKDNQSQKKSKSQVIKMLEWFHQKWIYVKLHWRASLLISGLIVILLSLFIVAVLLITLLPKKKDSIQSNNFTPGPQTTGVTDAPESPHGFGRVNKFVIRKHLSF